MKDELLQTLSIYKMPSESLWRAFELTKLRALNSDIRFKKPILEIGCGDGAFSSLIFDSIDDGIDISPRAIARCKQGTNVYKRLSCMNAANMAFPDNSYYTVFANCVIEHIPDLDSVLRKSYRLLMQGGNFVTTVPLREMNSHLLLRTNWYAKMRQRQLRHVNLLTLEEWLKTFRRAGFSKVLAYPYLLAKDCYYWDLLDLPICIGLGRYSVSTILRLIIKAFPLALWESVQQDAIRILSKLASKPGDDTPCAVAIIAYKQ